MFTTGVADGHIDLLEKVRKYLVDEVGWTQLDYTGSISPSPDDDLDNVTLALRAPGAITGQEFFINFRTESRTTDGSYGWRMSAATDWDAGLPDNVQLMASPFVYFNTWQNSINYWIYANDRRFVLVAKCNVSYISMYAGLMLPYALPSEYLKPFCLIGNSDRLEPHNINNSINQMIANPGNLTSYVLNLNGDTWLKMHNQSRTDNTDVGETTNNDGRIWPHRSLVNGGDSGGGNWNLYGFFRMRPNLQGESPQFLCQLVSGTEGHLMGALDGVYSTAGFGRVSEQILTIESRSYRVFQNIFRTTPRDFMSVEEF